MKKAIVLDTCLMVLFVVGLTNQKFIEKHKNLYPVYRDSDFRLLFDMVKKAPGIVCTAHIWTETSNLIRQIGDPARAEIMSVFQQLIRNTIEVPVISASVTHAAGFIRLGLTDAAIVSLDPALFHIFSVDHDLIVEAHRFGFEVTNLAPLFLDPTAAT